MATATTSQLQGVQDRIYMGARRAPRIKILLYDQTDTMSDIVLGQATQQPLEITDDVVNCSITDNWDKGSSASLSIESTTLSPYHFVGRRIIRILYQDQKVLDEYDTDYIPIFTGVCVGQPGYTRNRRDPAKKISVTCQDRSFYYTQKKLETPPYLQGEDLGDVAVDMATDSDYGLGLEREEVKFGKLFSNVQHTQVAFFDVPMMEGLQLIGFLFDVVPAWDGAGFLVYRNSSLTKPPVRVYANEDLFGEIAWPQAEIDLYNRIRVVGLDSNMSKVSSPEQELATVTGAIGYFQDKFKKRVYYSDDMKARADNVFISSYKLDGQLGKIFSFLRKEPYLNDIQADSCKLVVPSNWQPWIFSIWVANYVAMIIVSEIISYPPVKAALRMQAAAWLGAGLLIMQQIGNFEVTIAGTPYQMVYKEIEGVAEWANLQSYEVRELEIENHLVYSQDLADSLAFREMKREKVKGMTRNFSLPIDPFLEPHDIIELPDGTHYYLTQLTKEFTRGQATDMQCSAWMVRSGKEYNNETGFSEY